MYDPLAPRSRVFLPAILSGFLLYICYFPLNLGPIAWVALVPLLSLVEANARPRRIYFAAFVGGLFCYVPAIQWMRVAHPAMYASWLGLGIYCSLCQAGAIYIVRKLVRVGIPFWVAVPVAWVSVEYFRSHFPTGFSWLESFGVRVPVGFGWYMLGHSMHDWLPIIQIADITGVYGLSLLVAMVNAVVYMIASHVPAFRNAWRTPFQPDPVPRAARFATVALLLGYVVYGQVRLRHQPFADGPTVALIQGNLAQDIKNMRGDVMADHFGKLADEAVRPPKDTPRPDLVVWPETAFVVPWFEVAPEIDRFKLPLAEQRAFNESRNEIQDCMSRWRVPMLFGLNALDRTSEDKLWKSNSALLVDARGRALGRYDKMHLVPFGEYVPMVETFPFMRSFTPYEGNYSCKPGERCTRFPLTTIERTYQFACIICYEDTDATLARQYVKPGSEKVDFFVNISNDGWFDGTEEHEQHLAICRFRAVETRRSVVRAVNMGISAIIDPDGRVIAKPGETWAASKKVEAIVRGVVPIDGRDSLYARYGDWLPILAWFIVLGGYVREFALRRKG